MVGFATTFAFSCLPTAFALQAREIHRVVVYFLATFAFFRILNFLNINRGVWAFSKIPPIYKDNHNRKKPAYLGMFFLIVLYNLHDHFHRSMHTYSIVSNISCKNKIKTLQFFHAFWVRSKFFKREQLIWFLFCWHVGFLSVSLACYIHIFPSKFYVVDYWSYDNHRIHQNSRRESHSLVVATYLVLLLKQKQRKQT